MSQSQKSVTSRPAPQSTGFNTRGEIDPLRDVKDYLTAYARQNPERAALICFGIGFVVGWRLKPW